jgi:molybdate transport system substrate-binding protein
MRPSALLLAAVAVSVLFGKPAPALAQQATPPVSLKVAAAADLQFALGEISAAFAKENPGVTVSATYGSSGVLTTQIQNGAVYDLFLSADAKYPKQLVNAKAADASTVFAYAVGRLVVWVPKGSPLDVEKLGAKVLLDPAARKIAIANPEHAPYGKAAVAALKTLGIYDQIAPRLVLGENIAQTAQFVESGAADAGVIALSLAIAPAMKGKGSYWAVPLCDYPQMVQTGIVPLNSPHPGQAQALVAFLKSEAGRAILDRYGFQLPQ